MSAAICEALHAHSSTVSQQENRRVRRREGGTAEVQGQVRALDLRSVLGRMCGV
jgi:hypothetical protein